KHHHPSRMVTPRWLNLDTPYDVRDLWVRGIARDPGKVDTLKTRFCGELEVDRHGGSPAQTPVRGLTGHYRKSGVQSTCTFVHEQGRLIQVTIGGNGHPRIRGAVEVTPGAQAQSGNHHLSPMPAAVETHPGHQPAGATVRPAVLLKDADEVVRIGRVDGQPRL